MGAFHDWHCKFFWGYSVFKHCLLPLGQALFTRSCHEDVKYFKSAQKYSKSTPKLPKKYSKSTPKVPQKCSKSTPTVPQKYSKSTPNVLQKYSKSIPKVLQNFPKKYSKSTPKVPQKYSMEYSKSASKVLWTHFFIRNLHSTFYLITAEIQ